MSECPSCGLEVFGELADGSADVAVIDVSEYGGIFREGVGVYVSVA